MKERMNERKKEEMGRIESEEKVELGEIKYNEERPRVNSVANSNKNVGKIETKPQKPAQNIPLPPSQ